MNFDSYMQNYNVIRSGDNMYHTYIYGKICGQFSKGAPRGRTTVAILNGSPDT